MSRSSWSESQWGRRGCLGQGTRWKPLMELENQTGFAVAISLCCCGAGRPCDSQLPDWTNSELRSVIAVCVICRHGIDVEVKRHSRRHSRSKNETFICRERILTGIRNTVGRQSQRWTGAYLAQGTVRRFELVQHGCLSLTLSSSSSPSPPPTASTFSARPYPASSAAGQHPTGQCPFPSFPLPDRQHGSEILLSFCDPNRGSIFFSHVSAFLDSPVSN